jgi:hypothetical protein
MNDLQAGIEALELLAAGKPVPRTSALIARTAGHLRKRQIGCGLWPVLLFQRGLLISMSRPICASGEPDFCSLVFNPLFPRRRGEITLAADDNWPRTSCDLQAFEIRCSRVTPRGRDVDACAVFRDSSLDYAGLPGEHWIPVPLPPPSQRSQSFPDASVSPVNRVFLSFVRAALVS